MLGTAGLLCVGRVTAELLFPVFVLLCVFLVAEVFLTVVLLFGFAFVGVVLVELLLVRAGVEPLTLLVVPSALTVPLAGRAAFAVLGVRLVVPSAFTVVPLVVRALFVVLVARLVVPSAFTVEVLLERTAFPVLGVRVRVVVPSAFRLELLGRVLFVVPTDPGRVVLLAFAILLGRLSERLFRLTSGRYKETVLELIVALPGLVLLLTL